MDTNYRFNLRRRFVGALPPLGIAFALGVLLLLFGTRGTWQFWVVSAVIALLLARAVRYLWWSRSEVVIDSTGLTRSGRKVPYAGAELELQTVERNGQLAVHQVILWAPRGDEGRDGVGFDDSLEKFEQAVRALVARVPEMRIRVSSLSEPDIQAERREAILAPLRPTPAERALQELGKSALNVPPHLRN